MTGTATYMYAITRPGGCAEPLGLPGVGGAPVRTLSAGPLACLVSTVDLADFGEEALQTNLEDLAWLERTARQHDEVVRASARMTTTVPLRLATICIDDDAARQRLVELGERAAHVLDELDGRDEWGVKLFVVEPAKPAEHVGATAVPAAADRSTGVAYLQRRRQQLDHRSTRAEQEARDAEAVFRQLERQAVRAHRHRPQDQRLTGVAAPMVLNAAYLVDRDRVQEFRRAIDELAAERPPDSVLVTGPWPPYSFASVEQP